jgi:hypothetical protein
VLSLLLCVATVGLWVRSYYKGELFGWMTGSRTLFYAVTGRGGIGFASAAINQNQRVSPGWNYDAWRHPSYGRGGWPQLSFWNRRGFVLVTTGPYAGVLVPTWSLAALLLSLPAVQSIVFCVRRRRVQHGVCPSCGYDLRATPNRCPECGTVPKAAAA